MKWKKLRSPTRATLTNPGFQSFCELGNSLKYKNPNFESKDELKNAISQFQFHCFTVKFT